MEADQLTAGEKENLLKLARKTIEEKLFGKSTIDVETELPVMKEKRGAFVTLHIKGELKGCIGYIVAQDTVYSTIKEMALSAAFKDPRFRPLTKEEYKDIDIEISILTPLIEVESWKDVVVGKHGIIITKGYYKGVLLPQVATEYGWDTETFIRHGCMKAGLSPDEYKRGVTVEVFSACVFGEKDFE